MLNGQNEEDLVSSSFTSTDDRVVAGYSTQASDGLVQVFVRVGGALEEVTCVSTLGAEVGWGEQVKVNPEVWGLMLSLVLRDDTEDGTKGDVGHEFKRVMGLSDEKDE